jgi:putative acyl-CoA dehydrogenase
MRAIERSPESLALLLDELEQTPSNHAGLRELLAGLRRSLDTPPEQREAQARRFAQRLVLAAQATLMQRHAPEAVAAAFIDSRIDAENGRVYGTLAVDTAVQQQILKRAWPLG